MSLYTQNVADQNVERLLATAYRPESADPGFVEETKDKLLKAARELAQTRSQTLPLQPARDHAKLRRRLGWTMALAAALSCVYLVQRANQPRLPSKGGVPDKGDLVHKFDEREVRNPLGLHPKKRPEAAKVTPIKVGETIATGAAERRRVVLEDGSVVYVNENTSFTATADRKVNLARGEVYVEVSPREAGSGATFEVTTPSRQIAALGTRFSVQADPKGSGVLVTQGKVSVSDMDRTLTTGQRLITGSSRIEAAPRATHELDWTKALMAAAESPLVPGAQHCGGALLAIDPFGQEIKLTLRKFHIDVHIEDGFARTTIDQTYFNNESARLEGTFYFPLPPDASLSRLAMYVEDGPDSKLNEGGMAEKKHAANVYETIRNQQRDPALLEWVDGSTFKMRVFPLEGRKEKRIILSYSQRLPNLYGIYRYRFPTGHTMELVRDWSFFGRVKHGAEERITSPSHPDMHIAPQGGDMTLSVSEKNTKPTKDVVLEILDKTDDREIARFSGSVHEKHEYLMLRYRPELKTEAKLERRDWVILFESGSNRDPLLARTQIEVVKNLLDSAEHGDTFTLLTANTRVHLFDKNARPLTQKNIDEAVAWLETTHLIGALDLNQALEAATPLLNAGRNPHLVHVGAGVPALGERSDDVLAAKLPNGTRYVGIGVGKKWNRGFMKMAADRTGGYFTQINPDEPILWKTFDLIATLNTPRLMDLSVVDPDGKITFLSESLSLAQGEEVCAITRADSSKGEKLPAKVVVKGKLDGKPFTRELEVAKTKPGADYLPRTWAKMEIDRLLAAGAEANKEQITKLSMAMYVMSPFTSLLVLETDKDYETFKVDRGRKDHWAMYSCPDRIPTVYEPDLARQAWWLPRETGEKQPLPQVLAGILIRPTPRFLTIPGVREAVPSHLTALHLYQGAYAAMDDYFLGDGEWKYGKAEASFLGKFKDEAGLFENEFGIELGLQDPLVFGGEYKLRRLSDSKRFKGVFRQAETIRRVKDLAGRGTWMELDGLDLAGEIFLEEEYLKARDFRAPRLAMVFRERAEAGLPMDLAPDRLADLRLSDLKEDLVDELRAAKRIYRGAGLSRLGRTFYGRSAKAKAKDPLMAGEELAFDWDGDWAYLGQMRGHGHWSGGLPGAVTRFDRPLEKALSLFDGTVEAGTRISKDKGWALEYLAARVTRSTPGQHLIFSRPRFENDYRLFGDLTLYAPGLQTRLADITSTLEREAKSDHPVPMGKIDDGAGKLIDRARAAGWQTITIPGTLNSLPFQVTFNGKGHFQYERILPSGLNETVAANDEYLWHLYPEIGLGGRRVNDRHQFDEIAELAPWLLPAAEEMARGAEVKLLEDNVIAVIPQRSSAKGKDGKEPLSYQLHLVFEGDRVAERRVVEMPTGRVVLKHTYAADGTCKLFNQHERVVSEVRLARTSATAPNVNPDTNDLLVIRFPVRTRNYYHRLPGYRHDYVRMSKYLAEDVFVTECLENNGTEGLQLFAERFHCQGDRRIGFYTLLNAARVSINHDYTYSYREGVRVIFDVVGEHPDNPLAKYLDHNQGILSGRLSGTYLGTLPGPKHSFLSRISRYSNLLYMWNRGDVGSAGTDEYKRKTTDTIQALRDSTELIWAWAVLDSVQRRGVATPELHEALAGVHKELGEEVGLIYGGRYQHAASLSEAGKKKDAKKLFLALYEDAYSRGVIPPIDGTFRDALNHDAKEGTQPFAQFLRERHAKLMEERRPLSALQFAWQTYQMGERALAGEFFLTTVNGVPEDDRNLVRLAGLEFLWHTGQYAYADTVLQKVLEDPALSKRPFVWRIAVHFADRRGMLAKSVTATEKAMDLEYQDLPEIINLEAVRQQYRGLLNQYQQMANAFSLAEKEMPKDLIAKVVKVADRWRSLDPENMDVPEAAARVLQLMGAKELAWDYLTTPIGMKPGESEPWVRLAQNLASEADFELADRAYDAAFRAEPTNAQILWDRAHNLQTMGRMDQARLLYRQIADTDWQPRFDWIRQQARALR